MMIMMMMTMMTMMTMGIRRDYQPTTEEMSRSPRPADLEITTWT